MEYGELIRRIRRSKHLTQKEAAKDIMSERTLISFEKGKHEIGLTSFFALLKRLEISPTEFVSLYEMYNVENEISDEIQKSALSIQDDLQKGLTPSKKKVTLVQNYLLKMEKWGAFEMMFTSSRYLSLIGQ